MSDVNPTVRDRCNNCLNPQKLKLPPSRRSTHKSNRLLHWNQKDQPRRTRDIMVEILKTPNDAHNINYATITQEYKFKFERSRPCYSIQVLEKRPRRWGESVVCLANLASHIIVHDLIRLGVMCMQGDDNTSPRSTTHNAPRKPHSYDLKLG